MLVQFSMFPTGDKVSVSGEVSRIIDIVDKSGFPYKTSAMATTIEGEWDEIIDLINRCRLMLRENNQRVYMVLTMDDRENATNRLNGKIRSIEEKLNRKIKS